MRYLLAIAALLLTVQGVTAVPPEVVSVDGTFIDRETGRGIPHAKIELRRRHRGFPMEAVSTFLTATMADAKGRFQLVGRWRGKLVVECESPNGRRSGYKYIEGAESGLRILTPVSVLNDPRHLVPAPGSALRKTAAGHL